MKTSTLFKAFFLLPALFACSLASAQDESSDAGVLEVLEEVLVTATRRVSDLQSTPVAVTALSGKELGNLFAHDIGETDDV